MTKPTCTIERCDRQLSARGMCATHYRNVRLYGRVEGAPDPACETCGSVFPRPGKSGPLPRYCSTDCNPLRRPRLTLCKCCGVEFDRGVTNRLHCSERCMTRWRYHSGLLDYIGRACVKCGDPLDFDEVGKGGRRLRTNTRKCRSCRRPGYMPTTVHDLAARDGFDCSLCGEPVDFSLAWPERMAPTRDHVIPYSRGGSNDAENLRLAHFICNVRKSNDNPLP